MQRKLFDDVVEVRPNPLATITLWFLAYLVVASWASCSIAVIILFLEWCHGA